MLSFEFRRISSVALQAEEPGRSQYPSVRRDAKDRNELGFATRTEKLTLEDDVGSYCGLRELKIFVPFHDGEKEIENCLFALRKVCEKEQFKVIFRWFVF